MDNNTIKQINKQTTVFYKNVAPLFSELRQFPWKGWYQCLPYIKKLNPKTVADLGCGNGRFYGFLEANGIKTKYTGYDNNDYFLKEAKKKYPDAKFVKKDIFNMQNKIDKKYDLVVGFGITHHIPNTEFRQKWFSQLENLINKGGLFLFTFWEKDSDTKRKGDKKIGKNDYMFDFSKTGNKRYFHKYTQEELDQMLKKYKIINEFYADGKTNDLNRYITFSIAEG